MIHEKRFMTRVVEVVISIMVCIVAKIVDKIEAMSAVG